MYNTRPIVFGAKMIDNGKISFLFILKGRCLIFLSAIYQLFIKYFNIK